MTTNINDAIPWYTWSCVHWLEEWLTKEMTVFEWGSGGSTIFFAHRCKAVVSVEHNAPLVAPLFETLQNLGLHKNAHIIIEPPENYHIQEYESQDEHYANTHNFKNYARAIDRYPNEYFDLVAVDGRARPACIIHAIPKVKPGGILLLDNAERYYYTAAVDKIPRSWKQIAFYDHGPFIHYRWLTVIWRNE